MRDMAGASTSLLFKAQDLASTLQKRSKTAARTRQRRRDALELLEKVAEEFEEGISSDQAERMEGRLRAFADAVGGDGEAEATPAAADGSASDVEARLDAMQRELVALRRTTVAGLAEIAAEVRKK